MGAEDDNKSDTKSTDTDLNTPISCIRCHRPSCRRLFFTFNNYWQLVGMSVIVVIYSLIGALIFNAVERPNELRQLEESRQASENAITQFVYMLTNTTNLTEEEARNTTTLFLEVGRAAAEAEANLTRANNPIWDYSSSVFFVSTVITTIGYGTIAPSTHAGQIFFIFYAIIGIPLALLFLAQIGKIIEKWVNRTLKPVERRWGATASRGLGSLSLFLTALIFFVLIPAIIFSETETWDYGQSVYYAVVTLTTVGFGDFVPSLATESSGGAILGLYKIMTTFWLWMGLAIVSALISEIQTLLHEAALWCHKNKCCCVGRKRLQLEKVEEMQEVGE